MNKITFFWAFVLSMTSLSLTVAAQDKPSKEDEKRNKSLQATWSIETLQKGTRLIDFKGIAGESFMHFYPLTKTDKETGKKKIINKFKMEMGGSDRIFDYQVKGDSIKFVNVNGWNDFKVVELDGSKLVVEQLMDGDLLRYNLKFITKLKAAPGATTDDKKGGKDKKKGK